MSRTELDPTSTALRPLAEYCDRLPSRRRGRKLNRATLWRWALNGKSDGRYLRTVGLGSGRFTCDAWVSQFLSVPLGPSGPEPKGPGLDAGERARIARNLGASTERRPA